MSKNIRMSYFLLSRTNNPKIGSHDNRHNKWPSISPVNSFDRIPLSILNFFLYFPIEVISYWTASDIGGYFYFRYSKNENLLKTFMLKIVKADIM